MRCTLTDALPSGKPTSLHPMSSVTMYNMWGCFGFPVTVSHNAILRIHFNMTQPIRYVLKQ